MVGKNGSGAARKTLLECPSVIWLWTIARTETQSVDTISLSSTSSLGGCDRVNHELALTMACAYACKTLMSKLPKFPSSKSFGPQSVPNLSHLCFLNNIKGFPASTTSFGLTSIFSTLHFAIDDSALTLISNFIASRITKT